MNKQELQNEINKTKKHLANMEKMLAECEYERWRPSRNEEYFIVSNDGISRCINIDEDSLDMCYNFYNCFQTEEQALTEAEKILVRRMLEDIARKLNKGKEIDWNNTSQSKYFLCIKASHNDIIWDVEYEHKNQGVVYCLDMNFRKVAIQKIGEERLEKYLRGE